MRIVPLQGQSQNKSLQVQSTQITNESQIKNEEINSLTIQKIQQEEDPESNLRIQVSMSQLQQSCVYDNNQNCERPQSQQQTHTCWLCQEDQSVSDPFVCNCQCSGSNQIHAQCLMQIVVENIQKIQKKDIGLRKKKEFNQECSICKFKFKVDMFYNYKMNCKITLQNRWYFILSILSFLASMGFAILTSVPFAYQQEYGQSSIYIISNILMIFLSILCIVIGVCLFLVSLLLILKAFLIQSKFKCIIISDIKDKKLTYYYNAKLDKFSYYIPHLQNPVNNFQLQINGHNITKDKNLIKCKKTKSISEISKVEKINIKSDQKNNIESIIALNNSINTGNYNSMQIHRNQIDLNEVDQISHAI